MIVSHGRMQTARLALYVVVDLMALLTLSARILLLELVGENLNGIP